MRAKVVAGRSKDLGDGFQDVAKSRSRESGTISYFSRSLPAFGPRT